MFWKLNLYENAKAWEHFASTYRQARRNAKGENDMKKLLLLMLAIVLSACSAIASAGQPKSEVEQARDKWQAANISHYRFNLSIGCFCVFTQDMPLVIEVKDGQVVSMQYQSGKQVDSNVLDYFNRFTTIDKIFSEIENGFKVESDTPSNKADEVKVTYDETYGFPTQVSVDFIKDAADDELGLTISNFEKLP
jgi:hypothetical protein